MMDFWHHCFVEKWDSGCLELNSAKECHRNMAFINSPNMQADLKKKKSCAEHLRWSEMDKACSLSPRNSVNHRGREKLTCMECCYVPGTFTYIVSSYKNTEVVGPTLVLFYRWRNWGLEWLTDHFYIASKGKNQDLNPDVSGSRFLLLNSLPYCPFVWAPLSSFYRWETWNSGRVTLSEVPSY